MLIGVKFLVPSLGNFHPPFKQKNHKYFILMISLYMLKKGMFYAVCNLDNKKSPN
nr:MAG TPA: hypothetical protein [Caudoviricetes sp.]